MEAERISFLLRKKVKKVRTRHTTLEVPGLTCQDLKDIAGGGYKVLIPLFNHPNATWGSPRLY
jgi:hypothetical protein